MKSQNTAFILALIFGLAAGSQADSRKSEFKRQQTRTAPTTLGNRANQPWTGDDSPFRRIGNEVDAALARGETAKKLRDDYKIVARSKPKDAKAQFRWAYVARIAGKSILLKDDPDLGLTGVANAMGNASPPHSYLFDRLYFLVCNFVTPDYTTSSLGERLLKRNPKDYEVMYEVIKLLPSWKDPKAKQRALGMANQLVKVFPRRTSSYNALAYIYTSCWMKSKSDSDALNAISAYRKVLTLLPAGHPKRKRPELFIVYLEKWYKKRHPN